MLTVRDQIAIIVCKVGPGLVGPGLVGPGCVMVVWLVVDAGCRVVFIVFHCLHLSKIDIL